MRGLTLEVYNGCKSEGGISVRKKMLAAALLPLPFAAIPVFAVFVGGPSSAERDLAFESAPTFHMAEDLNVIQIQPGGPVVIPLAYTGADDKLGCVDVDGGI